MGGGTTFRLGPHADGPLAEKGATDDEGDFLWGRGTPSKKILVHIFVGTHSLKILVDLFQATVAGK